MENFVIKNQNIFLNLDEDEKIVYVAEKNKANFYYNFILLVIVCLTLLIFSMSNNLEIKSLWLYIFMFLIFFPMFFMMYKIIVECFFTELVLTNKKFIISRLNKLTFIDNSQVKRVWGFYGHKGSPNTLRITLISKKIYNFLFIDKNIVREKFKEASPAYDDFDLVAKDKKQEKIASIILLISIIILLIINVFTFVSENNSFFKYMLNSQQETVK